MLAGVILDSDKSRSPGVQHKILTPWLFTIHAKENSTSRSLAAIEVPGHHPDVLMVWEKANRASNRSTGRKYISKESVTPFYQRVIISLCMPLSRRVDHANSVPSVCLGSYVRPRSRVAMLLEKFKNFGMNCSTTGPATESSRTPGAWIPMGLVRMRSRKADGADNHPPAS